MTEPTTFTRNQVRQVDRNAVERYAIPSIVLMENASRQVADQAIDMLGGSATAARRKVLVICGGGNNGGDGLATARHLALRSLDVHILLLKHPGAYKGDARTNLDICQAMGLPITTAADDPLAVLDPLGPHELIIDAILGTGLDRQVRGSAAEVIGWINAQPAPVLAVDIPSGLHCDAGQPLGIAVEADRTVTFVAVKRGFAQGGAERWTGAVVVADIGAPAEIDGADPT